MSILSALLDAGTQSEDAVRPPVLHSARQKRALARENGVWLGDAMDDVAQPRVEGIAA